MKINIKEIGNNYQLGWHTGASFKFDFSNWFSLKSGIYYTQKKQEYTSFDTTLLPLVSLFGSSSFNGIDFNTYTETNGRHSLNFIQIPIMASFNYENFNVYVGGYFGFMFSSRTKELKENVTPFVSTVDLSSLIGQGGGAFGSFLLPPASEKIFTETSNSSNLSKIDYGLKTGVGYHLNNLELNVSYLYGFKDYRITSKTSKKQRNKYFQFTITYIIDIGKRKENSRFI